MFRKAILLTAVLVSIAFGQSPFKKEIPTVKIGDRIRLTLKTEVAADPKLFPKSDDVLLARDFNDPSIIVLFITPSAEGTLSFCIASNQEGKTLLYEYVANVVPGEDKKPKPKPKPPVPAKAKYTDRLKAAYLVSPDKVQLGDLITFLTAVNSVSYKTREEALAALVKNEITLKGVKHEIAMIISEDGEPFTSEKFTQTIKDVIASLVEVSK